MTVVYPVFSRLHASSRATLNTAYTKSFTYLLVLSLPIAVGGMMVADNLVPLVFGGEFRPSVLVFQVLVWTAFFDFVGYVNGPTLLAAGRERVFAVSWSLFIISNFFLDYLFIKRFGYIGACYVTLILKAGMFLLYSTMCHRQLNVRPAWGQLQKAIVATAAMGAAIWATRLVTTSTFLLVPVGIAAFLATAALIRLVPQADWDALRAAVGLRKKPMS
jgi:O-antigen/teichoic acid export membrane protein